MIAASCMVLYGYDASVYNSVQGSANWKAYFNHPEKNGNIIGSINTAYTVGAILGGFFLGGPIADYGGRKVGMVVGCILVIIATFLQVFAPRGKIACFLVGRCIIGFGQGIALSEFAVFLTIRDHLLIDVSSCWTDLHRRTNTRLSSRSNYGMLADVLLRWSLHLFLDCLWNE